MSRGERLSILGLYHWNNHLFDEMKFPDAFQEDDKQTVIGNILMECAELEILFPDYDICKNMIGLWSKFNLPTWNRIYNASLLEYNPIENYNRNETETINNSLQKQTSNNTNDNITGTSSQNMSSTGKQTNSGTDKTLNSVTAYDAADLFTHDQSILTHGHKIDNEGSNTGSSSYTDTHTITNNGSVTDTGIISKVNHTSGNIGVTTSQQMLDQEIEIADKINVIKMICESFKERFCLLVY